MITKDQMMIVLVSVCPSFKPSWEQFLAHWKNEGEDLPYYIALSEFSEHLIGMLKRSETGNFPGIFAAVERLCLEGDQYVQQAAVIGLLEDLQNLNLHSKTIPSQFRPFLGPESTKAWDEVYEFWGNVKATQGESVQPDPESIQNSRLRQVLKHLYRKD